MKYAGTSYLSRRSILHLSWCESRVSSHTSIYPSFRSSIHQLTPFVHYSRLSLNPVPCMSKTPRFFLHTQIQPSQSSKCKCPLSAPCVHTPLTHPSSSRPSQNTPFLSPSLFAQMTWRFSYTTSLGLIYICICMSNCVCAHYVYSDNPHKPPIPTGHVIHVHPKYFHSATSYSPYFPYLPYSSHSPCSPYINRVNSKR
jgi:hypothetical protein